MLDYEWGNQSAAAGMFPDEPTPQDSDQTRHFYDSYAAQAAFNETQAAAFLASNFAAAQFHHHPQHNFAGLCFDPRAAYGGGRSSSFAQQAAGLLSLEPAGFGAVAKGEPLVDFPTAVNRIGLDLGGRTYFSSAEDDFVSRLYRRSRGMDPTAANFPRCQAEGCNADLTLAKLYHRRHKVCEFHSKAAAVVSAGQSQRFCQQCSRFHLLTEFDNGKRSCRKRLADHNRRRRKTNLATAANQDSGNATDNQDSSSNTRSQPDSGAQSSSSVTAAV
ncbi:hypothetical protein DM860_004491 [Cuscuta australis]|uniref:SBP-type domain-containing protein n=1 Tax=Cuscuta australis TaxID=267555 RepID=A0A328E8V9_9ASTE|nr:hypothetical protein DM860_004491 [Cuscuta australis]